jgi:hypothetical protein
MPMNSMRTLVIGDLLAGTGEILRRLTAVGWGSRVVRTLREARDLFNTFDFQVVLASESLPDGRGYDLADSVSRRSRTLMVGVPLSESCLWLPVVYRGVNVLGRRALAPEMLEDEMKSLLGMRPADAHRDGVREIYRKSPFMPEAPGPQRATLTRRKYRDRDKEYLPFA